MMEPKTKVNPDQDAAVQEKGFPWELCERSKGGWCDMANGDCGGDKITICAEAHPCVEPLYGDNRVQWGILFMLFIWLNTK